ncbi:YdcD family protein [Pseudocitrobacter corydidari]
MIYKKQIYQPLSINGRSSRVDVSKMISLMDNKSITRNGEYIKRGDASFSIISIMKMDTVCGSIDVILSFFNDELVSVKYVNVSRYHISSGVCLNNISSKGEVYGSDVSIKTLFKENNIYYDIVFSDNVIDWKINKWVRKWS